MGKGYEKKYKVTRIWAGDYALLVEISRRTGISMAEALHKLIARQPELKPEPKPEPAQVSMMPVFFKPAIISIDGAAHFKPKSISSDGVTHLKIKSIR